MCLLHEPGGFDKLEADRLRLHVKVAELLLHFLMELVIVLFDLGLAILVRVL